MKTHEEQRISGGGGGQKERKPTERGHGKEREQKLVRTHLGEDMVGGH